MFREPKYNVKVIKYNVEAIYTPPLKYNVEAIYTPPLKYNVEAIYTSPIKYNVEAIYTPPLTSLLLQMAAGYKMTDWIDKLITSTI